MLRPQRHLRPVLLLLLSFAASLLETPIARADAPRALPAGKTPNDKRLGALKDLNGYFPFTPPTSKDAWNERAERVRRQVMVANGIWPMPTKTPVNAVVHGKVQREGYTVERVFLESYPGHFVTGSLYRPTGANLNKNGKRPGVLCPHGHWANGRFYDAGEKGVEEQIKQGAEKYEIGGRYPLQARCVQLARMGCVVFHYDMEGVADCVQLSHALIHRYAKQRPEMNTAENWGFFSTQAELQCQSVMGLQTYNSIRALDWFSELPDVDAKRIGVTGASGGGTQTFILGAVDPRLAAAFPAVMVSTAMQGGCTCENCTLLRIGTGNIELAGLFAPKPLGMTGADDWTKEIATKGFPELQKLYELLGAPKNVMVAPLIQFKHNYNYPSRAAMYGWFNEHLQINLPQSAIVEQDYKPLTIAEMTVWDDTHPKPPAGDDYERSLVKRMTDDAAKQLAALTPTDSKSLAKYKQVVGGAVDVLVGRGLPPAGAIEYEKIVENEQGDYNEFAALLKYKEKEEQLPVIFLHPQNWNKQVVVWLDERGKQGLYGTDGSVRPEVMKLVKAGCTVCGVDLIYQGEFLADGQPLTKTRLVNNPREFAGYTFGYNDPVFAQRVQDVLSVLSYVKHHKEQPEQIHLVGLNGAAAWATAAKAQAGDLVSKTVVDTAGFRFANVSGMQDPNFLPGSVKYGDLPGILALAAPGKLWLAGEKQVPSVVKAAYSAAGGAEKITAYQGPATSEAAVKWILDTK